MPEIVISEGREITEREFAEAESKLNEGDSGRVLVYVTEPPTAESLETMQNELISRGVALTGPITYSEGVVTVPFKKQLAPLLIIGAVLVGGGILLYSGYQITKIVSSIPWWIWVAGGIATAYLLFRPRGERHSVAGSAARTSARAVKYVPEVAYVVAPGTRVGQAGRRATQLKRGVVE